MTSPGGQQRVGKQVTDMIKTRRSSVDIQLCEPRNEQLLIVDDSRRALLSFTGVWRKWCEVVIKRLTR